MPRSKWHSTLKSNLANPGPKPSITKTTTTRLTETEPQTQQVQHTITITTSSEKSKSIILMIQEPQQERQEIIEIPLDTSMRTATTETENSIQLDNKSNKVLLGVKSNIITKNQTNNKRPYQRKLIQIPQQNSRPRIFLLTRPSNHQLVRLATQTQTTTQQQRNLNSQPHHLPQPQNTAPVILASEAIPSSTENKKIIRIPFLPRSQVQTFSVKSNAQPQVLKKLTNFIPQRTVRYQNQSPVQQEKINSAPLAENQNKSDQFATKQERSVKNTQVKSTTTVQQNNLSLSENKQNIEILKQVQVQSVRTQAPLTLASMAGIELTGADMSLSQADMSGAMPPTATVEEINVPVFIDEYLQQATASTSNNTNSSNNTNNNITINSNNNSSNNLSNEKGNEENNNILETLENFDINLFDINLLTENSSSSSKLKETSATTTAATASLEQQLEPTILYHQQQQQLTTEVAGDRNSKQHQMELQMMLDDILFNNNSNNTSNNNNNILTTSNINNNNNSNIINLNNMAETNETDEIFSILPFSQEMDSIHFDDLDNTNCPEEYAELAVNLNSMSNDFSLSECILNSQPSGIMFSSGCLQPLSQSQSSSNLIKDILQAEPYIRPSNSIAAAVAEETDFLASALNTEDDMCDLNKEINQFYTDEYMDEISLTDCSDVKASVVNPLKRNSSQTTSTSQHMLAKRLKLHLDTKTCRETVNPDISTPNVLDSIAQLMDASVNTANSAEQIYYDLISTSPQCASVKSEQIVDESTIDFSPPSTPYSINSFSNQTSYVNTAPNSPALTATTTTTKRGRGRPSKTHSDIPDLSEIQHLSENEQKKVLERAKNNEASRKSRLKHKERDNALEREETALKQRNEELEQELREKQKIAKKLKRALKKILHEKDNMMMTDD